MRYTVNDLLTWGKDHSYPQLILSMDENQHVEDYVKHGELNWRRMARNKDRRQLAWKRVQMWEEYQQKWAS
jgi:hypothetical protein